jgi:hypothetical protein
VLFRQIKEILCRSIPEKTQEVFKADYWFILFLPVNDILREPVNTLSEETSAGLLLVKAIIQSQASTA